MKKHLRLWAIVMTAFYLVGMMTTMAAAAAYSTSNSTTTVDKSEVTISKGGNATVTVTLKASANNNGQSTAATFTTSVTGGDGVTAELTGVVTHVSPGSTTPGSDIGKIKISVASTAEATDYTVTITAKGGNNNNTSLNSATVTVTVPAWEGPVVNPALSTTNPNKLTWGSKWNGFTPTDSNANKDGGKGGAWAVTEGDAILTAAGLELSDTEKGTIAMTDTTVWAVVDMDTLYNACKGTDDGTWDGKSFTGDVTLTKSGNESGGSASQKYTFTFEGIKPAFKTKLASDKFSGKYNEAVNGTEAPTTVPEGSLAHVEIYGPGTLSADVSGLPKGLAWKEFANGDNTLAVVVYGTPTYTCKDETVTFTATVNGVADTAVKYTPKFTIAADSITFAISDAEWGDGTAVAEDKINWLAVRPGGTGDYADAAEGENGNVKVGDEFKAGTEGGNTLVLRAYPGPIDWTATNLTETGLEFTVSDDTEFVTISGKYTTERTSTDLDITKYSIVAKNKYTSTATDTLTGNVMVWAAPTFDNSYVFHDANATKPDAITKVIKADWFNVGEGFHAEVPVSHLPYDNGWTVTFEDKGGSKTFTSVPAADDDSGELKIRVVKAASQGNDGDGEGEEETEDDLFHPTDWNGKVSESGISIDISGGKLYISGSTDRVPSGGTMTITVSAKNFATGDEAVEKPYTVTAFGKTAALGKKPAIALTAWNPAISVDVKTTGTPSFKMNAYVDKSAAKKHFGTDGSANIPLVTDNVINEANLKKYGIWVDVSSADAGILNFHMLSSNDNTAEEVVEPEPGTSVRNDHAGESLWPESEEAKLGYAYKNLPITITALNQDAKRDSKGKEIKDITTKKIATAKAALTVGADAVPYITAPMASDLYEYGLLSDDETKALEKKETIYVSADVAFPTDDTNPYVFVVEGHGPFDVQIKPDSKNGISWKLADDEVTGKPTITFSGTPSDGKGNKKDVATAFSITAKNRSTGKSAKTSIVFTSLPKIAVDTEKSKLDNKDKPATVGKKVKMAPKLATNSKKIAWEIDSVTWGDHYTNDSDTVSQDLSDIWGLELDAKGKGVLSGTAKKATGATPLVVTMHAYTKVSYTDGDETIDNILTTSDPITANIYIYGEKPKLGNKKVTIDISGDAVVSYGDIVDIKKLTNSKTEDASSNPKVEALDGGNYVTNHYISDMEPTETYSAESPAENTIAVNFGEKSKGLTLVASGDTFNKFSFTGTPAGAAKKETVEVSMNNWGATQTDKLTFTINGPTPAINPVSAVSLTSADTKVDKPVDLSLSNGPMLGSKIKWKISNKGTGVKVKLAADKSDSTKATLTINATKNFPNDGTTIKVTAQDSDSKKTGEVEITITNSAPSGGTSALEAEDTTSAKDEAEAEAKVIGEGTVTMGHQRTVASLTAGQRAQIEAQGYIVAAVLPEIEVDADGQYDFEVDLDADERVKAGAELVWFAFASKPTTDDEIVDFEDLDGNETKVVPEIAEGHEHPVVVAWPWLNAGTKYAPVIAVKADAAEADAMTEEGVKEAAEEAKEE